MKMRLNRKAYGLNLVMLAGLGLTGLQAAPSWAAYPSGEVNISGATLFVDFFRFPASTNDFIDMDGNGVSGFDLFDPNTPQQLAPSPTITTSPYTVTPAPNTFLTVNYRSVGSGNGLAEFVNYQVNSVIPTSVPSEAGLYNRIEYANLGAKTALGNPNTSSGIPIAQTSVDIAGMDVPTKWFVKAGNASDAAWNAKPTASGYGHNTATSSTGQSNALRDLTGLNTNTAAPDDKTVFDTTLAWVAVAYVANAGTGVEEVRVSELQHLYVTGRMPSGENLVAVTRDVGSGTRNAAMNSIGVDPSFGVGDNNNAKTSSPGDDLLGPDFKATNRGGSGFVEGAVKNHRLAVGYTGLFGGSRAAADAVQGQYEIINVMNDHVGGTDYVRPVVTASENNVINNGDVNTAWLIGGPFTFATVGDPQETNAASPTFMNNQSAAGYLVNLTDSIAAFNALPSDVNNIGMPGELLASRYTLMAALDNVPEAADPSNFVANPELNLNVQSANIAALAGNTTIPAYGSVGAGAGFVPVRTVLGSGTYTDGGTGQYLDIDGNLIAAGLMTNLRNKIAGDFNNDGQRTADDVDAMMAVAAWRAGLAPKPETGTGFSPEIVGDFNGDGNFDASDVRYWADGLHLVGGQLDRKAGFTAVDEAYETLTGDNNYFGTVLATGKAYEAGASRADVAGGAAALQRGGNPVGADGIVDAADIDYVYAQFMPINPAGVSWADLDQAVYADLSADMTGDLVIDQLDVAEIVEVILGTAFGDVDLDGKVDDTDLAVIQSNLGQAGGWADGSLDGTGRVTLYDAYILFKNYGFTGPTSVSSVEVSGSPIPEPATLSLLALGGLALLRRR